MDKNTGVNPILLQTPTINPYRTAASLILRRLQWDLNYKSWVSRARLKKYKNKFSGKKCVILCNGPSLNKVDFDKLEGCGIFTFGLNKINLIFSRTGFRPNAVVAVNYYVIQQNSGFYNSTDIPLFLSSVGRRFVYHRRNTCFLFPTSVNKFARDCSNSINNGATVTFVAMQLAFHMGFRIIGLVGCDHNFSSKGPSNMTVKSGTVDHSHFDPSYFAGGVRWQLPDLPRSEYSYSLAGSIFETAGGRVYNCTEGGHLNIFERRNLLDFLDQ